MKTIFNAPLNFLRCPNFSKLRNCKKLIQQNVFRAWINCFFCSIYLGEKLKNLRKTFRISKPPKSLARDRAVDFKLQKWKKTIINCRNFSSGGEANETFACGINLLITFVHRNFQSLWVRVFCRIELSFLPQILNWNWRELWFRCSNLQTGGNENLFVPTNFSVDSAICELQKVFVADKLLSSRDFFSKKFAKFLLVFSHFWFFGWPFDWQTFFRNNYHPRQTFPNFQIILSASCNSSVDKVCKSLWVKLFLGVKFSVAKVFKKFSESQRSL